MQRWTTHRGDEWFYADRWGRATASAGPTSVSIESIEPIDGKLTGIHLHELLWSAYQRFRGTSLLCYVDDVTRPVLEDLTRRGIIRWEVVQSPYSQDARVLAIEPFPTSGSSSTRRR